MLRFFSASDLQFLVEHSVPPHKKSAKSGRFRAYFAKQVCTYAKDHKMQQRASVCDLEAIGTFQRPFSVLQTQFFTKSPVFQDGSYLAASAATQCGSTGVHATQLAPFLSAVALAKAEGGTYPLGEHSVCLNITHEQSLKIHTFKETVKEIAKLLNFHLQRFMQKDL